MTVQMELSRIIISEINDQQVVYLKEVEGDRTFPILIGLFEATSIDRRVKNHQSPRPLTHDLLVAAVDLLYPASRMLRSRRLRMLPPTALHLQTPTLWPSPLHAQLERVYDPGALLPNV